jgi:hypothetical protein
MPEYIFLMHDDAVDDAAVWESYLTKLQKVGVFQGGSEIGKGIGARKSGSPPPISSHLTSHSPDEAAILSAAASI